MSDIQQAQADMYEAANDLLYWAMDCFGRLEQERITSEEFYAKFQHLDAVGWAVRSLFCWLLGHDWLNLPKPIIVRRCCRRCYYIEDV